MAVSGCGEAGHAAREARATAAATAIEGERERGRDRRSAQAMQRLTGFALSQRLQRGLDLGESAGARRRAPGAAPRPTSSAPISKRDARGDAARRHGVDAERGRPREHDAEDEQRDAPERRVAREARSRRQRTPPRRRLVQRWKARSDRVCRLLEPAGTPGRSVGRPAPRCGARRPRKPPSAMARRAEASSRR